MRTEQSAAHISSALGGSPETPGRTDAVAAALQPVVSALLEAHEQRVASGRTPRRRRSVDTPDNAILLELIVTGEQPPDALEERIGETRRTVRAALRRLARAGIVLPGEAAEPVRLDPAFTELVAETDLEPLRRTVARLNNGDRPRFMKALLVLADQVRES